MCRAYKRALECAKSNISQCANSEKMTMEGIIASLEKSKDELCDPGKG